MGWSKALRTPWALAAAIATWTLIAWGGRLTLLTGAEEWTSWLRIGGSVTIGLLTATTLAVPRLRLLARPVLLFFALWTVVVWARGLYVNFTESGTPAFMLVHAILGIGFFALAWWAVAAARGDAITRPDQGHGQKQGNGKPPGLAEG
jgi:hypothetical protein